MNAWPPSAMRTLKQICRSLTSRRRRHRVLPPLIQHRAVLSNASLLALRKCLAPEMHQRHEGIAYLYGLTDGSTTLVVGAVRPEARTSSGSFEVSSIAMAQALRAIDAAGLQLVGQAHSHPGAAYHSEGDEAGARMAYQGFVSIVLPRYGVELPSLAGSATYFFHHQRFVELGSDAVTIVSECLR